MTITIIDSVFSVSGPIRSDDMKMLKQRGVTTLICTRYDNEETDQLATTEMVKMAKAHHLTHFHVPVKSGHYNQQDIVRFWQAFCTAQGKVHGYCRTGTRASHLWALGQANQSKNITPLLTLLSNKGFNVEAISPLS